jgi:release factor H-coupled RctB family protein
MNQRAPINRFFSDRAWIEGAAERQLEQLADTETVQAVAAMPDLHPGKYGPVGCGMLSTQIHPRIVGSDIGCGMGLFMTDLKHRKLRADKVAERLKDLDEPWSGDHRHRTEQWGFRPSPYDGGLGTIGGGNHFCELQAIHEIFDKEAASKANLDADMVFVLVHSGSRALGYSVLESLLAKNVTTLQVDSEDGGRYLTDHKHAVDWAELNRQIIAERAAEAARGVITPIADLSHNFLELTEDERVLHRKGAAPSDRGLVPIPGSRETLSYLVQPLDTATADSLTSLAHGAGRKYDRGSMHGRVQNVKSVREKMAKNPFGGIVVCEDRNLLMEEAGDAYKNIDRVINDLVAFGLVKVVATFRPLVTFKTAQSAAAEKNKSWKDK